MGETSTWPLVWKNVIETIERLVNEFNSSRGTVFTTSRLGRVVKSLDEITLGVQVVPKRGPVENVVLQIDPNTRVIQFDGTIARPGVPRRDFFAVNGDGLIVLKEHMVGQPQPPSDPMTPEQFSKFVLTELFGKAA